MRKLLLTLPLLLDFVCTSQNFLPGYLVKNGGDLPISYRNLPYQGR
jgi:hypothetical protein